MEMDDEERYGKKFFFMCKMNWFLLIFIVVADVDLILVLLVFLLSFLSQNLSN